MVNVKNILTGGKKKHGDDDTLANIEVGPELGRGGFSVVKEVHRKGEAAGVSVAMKITSLELIQRSMGQDRKQLKAQLERMRRVSDNNRNPHIINFLDFRMSKTDLFTFSELCRGGDLFERIVGSPDGHYSEAEARRATYSLLTAVRDIHEIGVMHRDIKPENIFYRRPDDDAGDIVLADFGCSLDQTTASAFHRGAAGSPGYVAPEMAAGAPYNMLVDEWSTAITVYEMLTGRSPFVSQTPEELNKEVLNRAIPYPRQYWGHLSAESKDFVQRLSEKDPAKRMTAAQALDHAWIVGKALERVPSLVSDSGSSTMADSDDDGSVLTKVATRSSVIAAGSFAKPDPLAEICFGYCKGKEVNQSTIFDTSTLLNGLPESKLRAPSLARIAAMETDESESGSEPSSA